MPGIYKRPKVGRRSSNPSNAIEKLQEAYKSMEGCSDEELFKKFYETSESFKEIVKSYFPEEKAPEPTVTMALSEYERLNKTYNHFKEQQKELIEIKGTLTLIQEAAKANSFVRGVINFSTNVGTLYFEQKEVEKVLKTVLETMGIHNDMKIE